MGHYKSNLRDIEFTLFDVLERGALLGEGQYADFDVETAHSILGEIDRLAREDLAASYADGDREPPVFDADLHTVTVPGAFKKTYNALMASEVWRFGIPEEIGGTPLAPNLDDPSNWMPSLRHPIRRITERGWGG